MHCARIFRFFHLRCNSTATFRYVVHAFVCRFRRVFIKCCSVCFSLHRYYAIVKPLKYPMTITKKVVAVMILNTWISPALISFIPIFAGWYTTAEHAKHAEEHPNECDFKVNRVYGVISSSISFWIPCTIMLFTYYAIFREANRQEKQLAARQGNAMLMHRHSSAGGTNGTYGKITYIQFRQHPVHNHQITIRSKQTNKFKC